MAGVEERAREFIRDREANKSLGSGIANGQCEPAMRDKTGREVLEERILSLEQELQELKALHRGLPQEMHYSADRALVRLIRGRG